MKFFDGSRPAFKEIAGRSYEFAHDNVLATGLPLRRDDVSKSIRIALVTNETLRDCLAEKKLRQQFWYERFADLIVDRLWKELEDEYTTSHP